MNSATTSTTDSNARARRIIPLAIVFLNIILFFIPIAVLTQNLAVDTYVSASYLMCITSVLTIVIVSLITFLNYHTSSTWMPFALAFEYGWLLVVTAFQFISTTVVSADPTGMTLCSPHSSTVKLCSIHRATMAIGWMAFILLLSHITLLTHHVLSLARSTDSPFFQILTTPQDDLALFTSNPQYDTEKHLPRVPISRTPSPADSTSSSLGGKRKAPPPALDISAISANPMTERQHAQNPLYNTFSNRPIVHVNKGSISKPMEAVVPSRNITVGMGVAGPSAAGLGVAFRGGEKPRPTMAGPSRHEVMARMGDPGISHPFNATVTTHTTVTTLGPLTIHAPIAKADHINHWKAPMAWAVRSLASSKSTRSSAYSVMTDASGPASNAAATTSHRSNSTNPKLKPLALAPKARPQSKQLPPLPLLPQHAVAKPPSVAFRVGAKLNTTGTSVINRPDPRNKRPVGHDELAAEGGFWVSRHTDGDGGRWI